MNPMVRDALVLQLTGMKHTCIVAETLSEGLAVLPEAPFDIVFLDVYLPDGNGLDALRTIRHNILK